MAGMRRAVLPVVALALVGAWWWQGRNEPGAGATPAPVAVDEAPAVAAAARPAPAAVQYPGSATRSNADITPAEAAALQQQEAAHRRPPVASYTGADGRQHAFRYESSPQEASADRSREDRESQLRRELEADPAAFARKYRLQPREVERIREGTLPFPPALLE